MESASPKYQEPQGLPRPDTAAPYIAMMSGKREGVSIVADRSVGLRKRLSVYEGDGD